MSTRSESVSSRRAYILSALAVVAGGALISGNGPVLRFIENEDGWLILLVRQAGYVTVLLAVLGFQARSARSRGMLAEDKARRPGREWPLIVLGSVLLTIAFAGFHFALLHTTVATAVLMLASGPIIGAVLGYVLLGERVSRWLVLAVCMTTVGLVIMTYDAIDLGGGLGAAMALFAMCGYASMMVCFRKLSAKGRTRSMVGGGMLTLLIALVSTLIVSGSFAMSLSDVLLALIIGAVFYGGGFLLLAQGAKHLPAAQITLLGLSEVVLAPIWGWLIVNETPTVSTLLGGGFVLLAICTLAVSGMRLRHRG